MQAILLALLYQPSCRIRLRIQVLCLSREYIDVVHWQWLGP
jgi:hypothetical protein